MSRAPFQPRSTKRRQAGFTLIEALIAMTVFLLITLNVKLVVGAGQSAASAGAFMMSIEDELNLTVDRMSLALMAADSSEVDGYGLAPVSSETVRYQTALGMDDGRVVHGPLEDLRYIRTAEDQGRVEWRENPGTDEEWKVVWSKHVPIAHKAEILDNFEDDNGNDLQDEGGLAFTMLGRVISIHLTVAREDDDGRQLSRNKRSVITCRN